MKAAAVNYCCKALLFFLSVGQVSSVIGAPSLESITFSPGTVRQAESSTLRVDVPGAASIEAIFFRRPSGTSGFLPLGSITQSGSLFSIPINVPGNAATGDWRISELGVRDSTDETFRFLASDLFPGMSPCPVFDNIGVFGCGSDIIKDDGTITVEGVQGQITNPVLLDLLVSPKSLTQFQIDIVVENAIGIETIFFRRPSGTSGFLPISSFQQTGNRFSAFIDIPQNTAEGVWRISELGVRAPNDEVFRFLAADFFAGTSSCPNFSNIGVFACASDLVASGGLISVSRDQGVVPLPAGLPMLSFALWLLYHVGRTSRRDAGTERAI